MPTKKDAEDRVLESKILEDKIQDLVKGVKLEDVGPSPSAALWSKTYTETHRQALTTPSIDPQQQALLDRLQKETQRR